MLERQRRELADAPPRRRRARPAEKGRGRLGERSALEVGQRIEARHRRVVDAAAQPALEGRPRPRKILGERAPCEQNGRVVGKEAPVVGEQDEIEPREPAVGGEDVDDVHAAGGERRVRQRVLHDPHVGEAQAIVAPEPRPPVRALEEAGVEGRAQAGVAGEIADGPQAQPRRLVATDGERVRVVEAERHADDDALRVERGAHGADRRERGLFEDRLRDRARVLRIDVDGSAGERAPGEARAAKAEPSLGAGLAGLVDDLRDDLRQDVALGERLRADAEARPLRPRRAGGEQQREHREGERGPARHRRSSRVIARGGAWALRNSDTNGSAGRWARSASVPCCTTRPWLSSVITEPKTKASRTSWVTRTTVLRSSPKIRTSCAWRLARVIGSSAPSGSSSRSTGGSSINARIRLTRCRWPPLSW